MNASIKRESSNYEQIKSKYEGVKDREEIIEIERDDKVCGKIVEESQNMKNGEDEIDSIKPDNPIDNDINIKINELKSIESEKEDPDLGNIKKVSTKRVFVRNEILYEYLWKSEKIRIFESRKEDKMFVFKQKLSKEDNKLKKVKNLKKINKFRTLIESRLK